MFLVVNEETFKVTLKVQIPLGGIIMSEGSTSIKSISLSSVSSLLSGLHNTFINPVLKSHFLLLFESKVFFLKKNQ